MTDDLNKKPKRGGYGKPPKKHQFKPGQSGNPKGRPRGSKNFDKILEELFQKKVIIKENGEERKVSIKAALTQKLLVKALYEGDLKAMDLLFKHIERIDAKAAEKLLLEEKTKNQKSMLEQFADFEKLLESQGVKLRCSEYYAAQNENQENQDDWDEYDNQEKSA